MIRILNVTTSYAASVARLGLGQYVTALGKRPEKPLELYEFENCPFCRKVREALCLLDLEVFIYLAHPARLTASAAEDMGRLAERLRAKPTGAWTA